MSALHFAISSVEEQWDSNNELDAVKLLLKAGASRIVSNNEGKRAIDLVNEMEFRSATTQAKLKKILNEKWSI
jgi:ankyrin repeat protein